MILDDFKSHLKANLPRVESFHPFFNEALKKMLLAGGKHFRAQLLLGVVEFNAAKQLANAMDAALAVEFIHTYSLIHDDLPAMDDADFRRGERTLHKAYDEVTAILVGDALNTEAFLLLSRSKFEDLIKIKLIEALSFGAGINGMIIGQAIDCFFEDKRLDLAQLKFLHERKTAYLIAAALKMGAIIAEFSEEKMHEIYEFGLKLGLLFQINDDIIDFTSDAKTLGKPTNKDTHKNSFINLLGLNEAKTAKENLQNECLEILGKFDEKMAFWLKNLMEKYL